MLINKQKRKYLLWFLRRRECVIPTWQGWFLIILTGLGLFSIFLKEVQPFLACNVSIDNSSSNAVLVVEGWLPNYALDNVISEFKAGKYSKLYVTGGSMGTGIPGAEFKTYAEFGAARLMLKGLPSNAIQQVPAPHVVKDRTYNSAVALRLWFCKHGASPSVYHVISLGAHARRTRLMFEKALGEDVIVNITAVEDVDYDPMHWWTSSEGVRTVMSESISYIYARLFFHPTYVSACTLVQPTIVDQ